MQKRFAPLEGEYRYIDTRTSAEPLYSCQDGRDARMGGGGLLKTKNQQNWNLISAASQRSTPRVHTTPLAIAFRILHCLGTQQAQAAQAAHG